MQYRPEIDGLRALAVLPVILFHAGFSTFSGGYVGVDIFFVISGYLISTIIISDLKRDNFSLLDFYERRARRLLPALFLIILVSLPFAWFLMLPNDLVDFSKSLIAASTFSSNILFWLQTDYFAQPAELVPLLHTWSLAVEEQFYLFFPLFLIYVWRFGLKTIISLLSLIFIVSLILAIWATTVSTNEQINSASFYLLPTRGWELLIGVFIGFYFQNREPSKNYFLNETLSILGFFLIIYSIFFFDKTIPAPSSYTLIPTIGAALLILFTFRGTFIHKILTLKFFTWIGLISYSAYLWHFPILAITKYNSFSEVSDITILGLCMLSMFFAYLSWRFVERPFRDRSKFSKNTIFSLSFSVLILIAIIGFLGVKTDGLKGQKLPPNLEWQSLYEKFNSLPRPCNLVQTDYPEGTLGCIFGDVESTKSIMLYGDSHSQSVHHYLDDFFKEKGIKVIQLEVSGCEHIPTFVDSRKNIGNECVARFDRVMEYAEENSSLLLVILRWTYRLYPIEDRVNNFIFDNGEGCVERDSYRETSILLDNGTLSTEEADKYSALENFLQSFPKNIPTFLVYPIPGTGCNIARLNMNHYSMNKSVLEEFTISLDRHDKFNEYANNALDKIIRTNDLDNVERIVPRNLFCEEDSGRCTVQKEGIPLYYDDDHLSYEGSRILIDAIFDNKIFKDSLKIQE